MKYTITVRDEQGKVSFDVEDNSPGRDKTVKIEGGSMVVVVTYKPAGEEEPE